MVALSVVVVSWNAKAYVRECLESLRMQVLNVPMEVIVIDNASSDGTPEMLAASFPEVRLIRNQQNLGFAKANNIGIRQTAGRYVALINSDVNVPPECLQKLHDFMEASPSTGVAGPRMLGPDGKIHRSYMRFPGLWKCVCDALCLNKVFKGSRFFGGVLNSDFDGESTADVEVLNGWFLVVRRQALEQSGLLDESFFMYGEDMDWSLRFSKAGWRRVYCSDARALHYGGVSSSAAPTRYYIQMYKANLQYWGKHHTQAGVVGYWLTTIVHQVIRLFGYSAAWMLGRNGQEQASFKVRRSAACLAWLMGLRSGERNHG